MSLEAMIGAVSTVAIAGVIAIVAFRVSRQHLRRTIAVSAEFTTDAQLSEDLRDLIQTVTVAGSCAMIGVCLIGLARLTGKSWALAELAARRDLEIPYGWWGSLLSTGRI